MKKSIAIDQPANSEQEKQQNRRRRNEFSYWRLRMGGLSVDAANGRNRRSLGHGGRAPRTGVSSETLEVSAEICRTLIAQFGIFFECFVDQIFEARRQIGVKPYRWDRSTVQDAVKNHS